MSYYVMTFYGAIIGYFMGVFSKRSEKTAIEGVLVAIFFEILLIAHMMYKGLFG